MYYICIYVFHVGGLHIAYIATDVDLILEILIFIFKDKGESKDQRKLFSPNKTTEI